MNRLPALVPLLLASIALSAAAQTVPSATPAPAPAPAGEPKVFRYSFLIAETGFDPVQLTDLYSRNLVSNMFDSPYRFGYLAKPGTIERSTAAAMPEISADYRHYLIRLKPGIYFADDPAFGGRKRELTAADYVYSWKRFYDPRWKSPNYGSFELYRITGMKALRDAALQGAKFDYDREVPGLRAIDRYTIELRFDKPNPRIVADLADSSIFGAVAREVVEQYGDDIPAHPVGTGPFKLAEWRRSSFMAFDRNPNHRDETYETEPDPDDPVAVQFAAQLKGRKLPFLDRVEVSIIQESQPRWLAFLNADQDYLERVPFDLAPLALQGTTRTPALERRNVTVQRRPIIDITLVLYNMDDPVVGGYEPRQIALRRAMNLALDSQEIARSAYKGQAAIAQSPVMPMTYGYQPGMVSEIGQTDVARANALLDAYGYVDRDGDGWRERPDGSPLVIHYSTQPDQLSRIQDEVWKKSMARIHVQLETVPRQWPEQLRVAREGKYQVWMLALSASGPDGISVFGRAYGPSAGAENMSRFRHDEYDRLFAEADAMPDGPARLANMVEMEKILTAYAPMKFPLNRYGLYLSYPWVKHIRSWPFMSDWWQYVDVDMAERRRAGK